MVPDPWRRWLTALGDPANRVVLTVAGELRSGAWDMGERCLNDHMLHALLAGGQEGRLAGAPVRTHAGELLWVPPGTRQELRLAAGQRLLRKAYVRFRLLGAAGAAVPWPAGEPWTMPLGSDMRAAIDGIIAVRHQPDGAVREARLRAGLLALFAAWRAAALTPPGGLAPARAERLRALVAGDPARRWTTRELAAAVGLSPLHLVRCLRRTWGVPPRRWLLMQRIHAAADILREGDEPVGAIASRLGYRDLFLFSRQFAAVMGVSPSAWRHGA